jgi:hypothetical protein
MLTTALPVHSLSVTWNIAVAVISIHAICITDKTETIRSKMKCLLLYLSQ